ncbi:MAG: glutathione S-transferase family protein [Hyphomicrobiales bacterium]|nr:glutathione S-transferase family protein [Hyphomicrobiales bacterium]MCP4997776.1 glutathione S-transferase family protein [Hyphomicrobiales bacterium]
MSLTLYERQAKDGWRPSPFCWRTRFTLAHKGLTPDVVAIGFTEAERIAFSGQGKVPVLVDGERVVWDSWSIAGYLEDTYPDQSSLFGGNGGRELARMLGHWVDATLQPALAGVLAPALYDILDAEDQVYYRRTREARWGMTFEEMRGKRDSYLAAISPAYEPLRLRLAEAPYICGEKPAYGDYLVFGVFQWARCTDPQDLIPAKDAELRAWRSRMLDLFGGLARSVPAFESAA